MKSTGTMAHCAFGSESRKYTRLCFWGDGLPENAHELYRGCKCGKRYKHKKLSGVQDKNFMTKVGSFYPVKFCEAASEILCTRA